MSDLSAVDQFVANWAKERPFWEQLTQTAHDICKEGLKDRKKLKCHILHRTKEKESLETKLKKWEKARVQAGKRCCTEAEIMEDMIDLAGIRILLPFPDDVQEVEAFLRQEFGVDKVKARFKGLDENLLAVERPDSRFLGYRATHFLVTWKQPTGYNCGIKTNPEHVGKIVEVQVTTILMNGWQEAQHDLTYKELSGRPSDDERALLEIINGLAHSGEVALQQLHTMQKRRLKEQSEPFQDEYELTRWLKEWLNERRWPGGFSMIYVEILYYVIEAKDLKTPRKLDDVLRHGTARPQESTLLLQAPQNDLASFAQHYLWKEFSEFDASLWAIMKIGSLTNPGDSISERDTNMKAFIIVGAINMTLSSPTMAHSAEMEYYHYLALNNVDNESRKRMESALFSITCGIDTAVAEWKPLWYASSITCHAIGADRKSEEINKLWSIMSGSDTTLAAWKPLLYASTVLLDSNWFIHPDKVFRSTISESVSEMSSRENTSSKVFFWPGELLDGQAFLWQAPNSDYGHILVIRDENGKRTCDRYLARDMKWRVSDSRSLDFIHSGDGFKPANLDSWWWPL